MYKFMSVAMASSVLVLSACETTGGNTTARDAAIGGAIGAAAGAIIADDSDRNEGAVIGAVVGAAAGAAYSCNRNKTCPWNAKNTNQSQLYYDNAANRRYYVYEPTGDTYWENGEFRAPAG